MRLPFRIGGERQAPPPLDPGDVTASSEILPFEFVDDNRAQLMESAALWQQVTCIDTELREQDPQNLVRGSIKNLADSQGGSLTDGQLATMASHGANVLADVAFLVARAHNGGLITSSLRSGQLMLEGLPLELYRVAGDKDVKYLYGKAIVGMKDRILTADKKAAQVLDDFCSRFSSVPSSIISLEELFADGIDTTDPRFFELREMIRTDWYTEDPQASRLRQMVSAFQNEPDIFLDEFTEEIIGESEGDRKMKAIQDMARFALTASNTPESDESLRNILKSTRGQWHRFEDIDNLFSAYRERRLTEIERSFDMISGLRTQPNPRVGVTEEEIKSYKRNIRFTIGNREARRKRTSNGIKPQVAATPRSVKTVPEAEGQEEKPIYITKNTADGSARKIAIKNSEDLVSYVDSKVSVELRNDILACIEYTQANPIDRCSEHIKSARGTVTINNRKYNLRRFKPRNAQGLNVSREAGSYRICYTVIDGCVVITDVLDHDQFDRKYK